jgi:sulfoxide reductase heme-binding subunit YedZ
MREQSERGEAGLGTSLGSGREQRRRLLLHHLPLAVASALVLWGFMGLPTFDVAAYAPANIFSGRSPGTFPEGETPGEHGGQAPASGEHAAGATAAPTEAPSTDAGSHQIPPQHGGAAAAPTAEAGGGEHLTPGVDAGETSAPTPSSEEIESRTFTRQLTVASGYIALALLAATLLIGPLNLALRRRNPVSSYLRRDVGAWTAGASVVHVVVGLQVHGNGQMADFVDYFVADGSPLTNSFGLGNWTGLAATAIALVLLVLSSDLALRKLGAGRWKTVQRLSYLLFALVVAHAFFYGALVRLDSPFTWLLMLGVIVVLAGQTAGIGLWRRRHRRAGRATEGGAG